MDPLPLCSENKKQDTEVKNAYNKICFSSSHGSTCQVTQSTLSVCLSLKMQSVTRALIFHGNRLKHAVLRHLSVKDDGPWPGIYPRLAGAPAVPYRGLESTTVADVLKAKGEDMTQALYWCSADDSVHDAVKNMSEHNIGALVVMKPGEGKLVAGIITERDYLHKIIMQRRSLDQTKVAEIMTQGINMISVSSDTNILKAMELMTENHIRHVPVVDKTVVGMISVVDVVRTIVEQQHWEAKHLKNYISGDYY